MVSLSNERQLARQFFTCWGGNKIEGQPPSGVEVLAVWYPETNHNVFAVMDVKTKRQTTLWWNPARDTLTITVEKRGKADESL